MDKERKLDNKYDTKQNTKLNIKQIIYIMATILLAGSYLLMEGTDLGASGIAKFNNGYGLFDMHVRGYSPDMVYTLLSQMGTEGISHYKTFFLADYVFIISGFYTFFILSLHLSKMGKFKWITLGMAITTTAKAVLDLAENILLTIVMNRFPQRLDALISVSSVFTIIKFISFFAFLILLLLWSVSILIYKYIKPKYKMR